MSTARSRAFAVYEERCARCGALPDDELGYLDVHHRDTDITNNEVGNLEILCRPCHLEVHRQMREVVMPQLLTMAQAAEALGVSQGALRKWADQGKISVVRTLGGQRRFEPAVIERVRREMGYVGETETPAPQSTEPATRGASEESAEEAETA